MNSRIIYPSVHDASLWFYNCNVNLFKMDVFLKQCVSCSMIILHQSMTSSNIKHNWCHSALKDSVKTLVGPWKKQIAYWVWTQPCLMANSPVNSAVGCSHVVDHLTFPSLGSKIILTRHWFLQQDRLWLSSVMLFMLHIVVKN